MMTSLVWKKERVVLALMMNSACVLKMMDPDVMHLQMVMKKAKWIRWKATRMMVMKTLCS